jgi:hydrogenase nickel incorporation protein HypB
MPEIPVGKSIYGRNDAVAEENRWRFREAKVLAINLLSSPGSGKTSLLEQTVPRLAGTMRMYGVEGDVETENDADRLRKAGLEAVQIQTHGGCHLDATMVRDALEGVDLSAIDLLFIENVGNLVCPTNFDLGEGCRVVVASTVEGDDKPVKYPEAYLRADACVLNKIDLVDYVDFDIDTFQSAARRANDKLQFFRTSCRTGEGIETWCAWLEEILEGA